MAEMTIGKARDNFTSLIASLIDGTETEHIVKKRDVPVVRMTRIEPAQDHPRPFGVAKDAPLLLDDEAFDALDDEIAEEFGL